MSWAPDKSDIGEAGKCLPLFAFRASRPARVGAVPRGSHYAHLGGRRGSGLRKSRSAAARPRKSSTYIQKCLSTWERLGVAVNCLSTREPFWGSHIATLLAPPPPLLLSANSQRLLYAGPKLLQNNFLSCANIFC